MVVNGRVKYEYDEYIIKKIELDERIMTHNKNMLMYDNLPEQNKIKLNRERRALEFDFKQLQRRWGGQVAGYTGIYDERAIEEAKLQLRFY